jgi:tungstate transport system permease protein
MQDFGEAFGLAFSLVLSGDADLLEIIGLSLQVSLTGVAASCVIGLPVGAGVATLRFTGREAVVVTMNALMGMVLIAIALGVNGGVMGLRLSTARHAYA